MSTGIVPLSAGELSASHTAALPQGIESPTTGGHQRRSAYLKAEPRIVGRPAHILLITV